MRRINPAKAALAVGIVIGLYHLAWVGLVAASLAKPFMDFVLKLHFIQLDYSMAPFDPATGAMLVALTFAIGALFGLVFAVVWNWLAAKSADQPAEDHAVAAE
jgi:hypothetical protein